MIRRRELVRLELAACALAATVMLAMLVLTLDAVRFHLPALQRTSPAAIPLLVALGLEGMIAAVLTASLLQQIRRQHELLSRLPARSQQLHGIHVHVLPSRQPHAFCVGMLRPQVYISQGLLELLTPREMLSVLAHEGHHARRRDPLRRAIAKAISDAFWFLPTLRTAASAQAAIAELAADAVAIQATGTRPLAAALLAFNKEDALSGPTCARVSQLSGGAPRLWARKGTTVAAGIVILALAALATWLLIPDPIPLCLPLDTAPEAPLAIAILVVACTPAAVLARAAQAIENDQDRRPRR
jgi:Zn-dependent protease with chaperone function